MSARNDGGPAFPQSETALGNTVEAEYGQGGMSLRDYFAAAALAHPFTQADDAAGHSENTAAYWAYALADAMLEEREK